MGKCVLFRDITSENTAVIIIRVQPELHSFQISNKTKLLKFDYLRRWEGFFCEL